MNTFVIFRFILNWLPLPIIAIINGLIREGVYGKSVSELTAHQISTVTGLVLFSLYLWLLSRIWKLTDATQAIVLGLTWLALTLCFEFGFGHFVAGHPWSRLFYDYNVFAGRIWVLIPIWTAVAPYIAFRLRS